MSQSPDRPADPIALIRERLNHTALQLENAQTLGIASLAEDAVSIMRDASAALARLHAALSKRDKEIIRFMDIQVELEAERDHAIAEQTRALMHGTIKGYTAGENADSKHWRQRAEAAEAAHARVQAERDEAYGYLSRLFVAVAPQCTPLSTLPGVCTQIDNYIAGVLASLAALHEAQRILIAQWRENSRYLADHARHTNFLMVGRPGDKESDDYRTVTT